MHPSLAALAAYRQFVLYRSVPSATRAGKTDKFPCDYRTGKVADAHNPANWTDAETAQTIVSSWGEGWGVGFVFTERDPLWFLDIDECLIDGQWSPLAQQLCGLLAGCAIEISQSGRGLHLFGSGRAPAHGCTNKALGLEFYTSGRFAALTGLGALGDAATDATAVLPALVATYFPADASGAAEGDWTEEPCDGWNGPQEDGELLRRAMQSGSAASAFGNRASFADLWLADEQALSKAYPDSRGRPYDCSAADAALAQHLSFWTGKDAERISRLMRQSGLVREKWDSHPTYLRELTITRAVSRQVDVLQDAIVTPIANATLSLSADIAERQGDGMMFLQKQTEYFKGCVYVTDEKKVHVPARGLMDHEQFKANFGGYVFQLDKGNRKTTRDAWEACVQNEAFSIPKVKGTVFRPDYEPGKIIDENGQAYLNIYVRLPIVRKQGDPTLFINHIAKLLPDKKDATIFLSYLAACVQYQGTKFGWAPLLQGTQGNGKSFFFDCMKAAIGEDYTHPIAAGKLNTKFNGWLYGKILYTVADIYVTQNRTEFINELKPMITDKRLPIEAKGKDQVSREVCGNFIFNSNHKDAIRAEESERRFCILFCAQQSRDDMVRDGMLGADYKPNGYFDKLWNWFYADGAAIVTDFLHTYSIPAELNPAGTCRVAPITTSSAEAIEESLGVVEQEILEAIMEQRQGFRGNFISSVALEKLLVEKRIDHRAPRKKRPRILKALGYVYHPALGKDGQVNVRVIPDGRPRLYVKTNSLEYENLKGANEVAKHYEKMNSQFDAAALPFTQGVR